MPALPSSLFEPVWVQFAALWPEQPEFDPTHPLGCHRRRIPDRVVFEHIIAALVHGSGYERVASDACSDRTIRRRLRSWAEAGLGEQIHALALDAYDRMIGLDLADISADGAITKAPCGGDRAGRSPVDRGKGGIKRSTDVDGSGIPLGIIGTSANRHDSAANIARPNRTSNHPGPGVNHIVMPAAVSMVPRVRRTTRLATELLRCASR